VGSGAIRNALLAKVFGVDVFITQTERFLRIAHRRNSGV
jgi:hypothetical protein